MKEENIKIKSKCDGLLLDTKIFIPNKIKGIVQLSHGMVETKEYYYDFMKYLTKNGYVTIINDHRGHGKSIKDENDLGYFYDESANYIVEDLFEINNYIKNRFPNKELILLGHSMGSLVVRKYLAKYDNNISKLIVCGSPSINPLSKIGLLITKLVKKFKGDRYRSKLLNNLALGNDKDNNWLSTDLNYVNKYNNDKLCGYVFTTNGFINLTKLMIDTYSKNIYHVQNKNMPIFFIAGENDPIIKSKKKWLKSINFLKNVGYKNITYKLYPNMKHALLNEKNKELVYQDILNYINTKNED